MGYNLSEGGNAQKVAKSIGRAGLGMAETDFLGILHV